MDFAGGLRHADSAAAYGASESFVAGVLRPELIIIDAAAKADLWPVLSYYDPCGYLLIGVPL
ncbi:hypothetical protein BDV59DRAFT_205650 [Aspergillus ambiguus]|uniref:uncharacterized protein n=1 Tax=Aspergillus ambiguus TaxID=176160 RepID=UPI003CCE0221